MLIPYLRSQCVTPMWHWSLLCKDPWPTNTRSLVQRRWRKANFQVCVMWILGSSRTKGHMLARSYLANQSSSWANMKWYTYSPMECISCYIIVAFILSLSMSGCLFANSREIKVLKIDQLLIAYKESAWLVNSFYFFVKSKLSSLLWIQDTHYYCKKIAICRVDTLLCPSLHCMYTSYMFVINKCTSWS